MTFSGHGIRSLFTADFHSFFSQHVLCIVPKLIKLVLSSTYYIQLGCLIFGLTYL